MPNNIKDMTGKRYGKLVGIRLIKREGKKTVWLFQCDCGEETERTISYISKSLKKGQTPSCGCYGDEKRKEGHKAYFDSRHTDRTDITVKRVITTYVSRSKREKIPFTLTHEQVKEVIYKNCHYCGSPPDNEHTEEYSYYGEETRYYSGIDKINPELGYTPGNVVPCCIRCNWGKGDYSQEFFLAHLLNIYKHLNLSSRPSPRVDS